jgi:hypothetical protein
LLRIDQQLAQALAGSGSSAQAAPWIVGAFCQALGWACGTLWSRDAHAADRLVCLGARGIDTLGIAEYLGYTHGRRPIQAASHRTQAPVSGPRDRCDAGARRHAQLR